MKRILISVLLIALFTVGIAEATVLRVNNNLGATAPYTTFSAAYTAAVSGDTIYVEGSATGYGGVGIYKKLVIIDSGYFLTENTNNQANTYSTIFDYQAFYDGSDGSEAIGLTMDQLVPTGNSISKITVKNCNIKYIYGAGSNSTGYLTLANNIITSYLHVSNNCQSLVMTNNILSGVGTCVINPQQGTIVNNTFSTGAGITANKCNFTNNIMNFGDLSGSDNTFFNNVVNGTQVPDDNGNLRNVDMSTVFVCSCDCSGYSTDGKYVLSATSPAKEAGLFGEDCGAFGGTKPYILSGMPPIPSIYYLNVPGVAAQNNALKVTVKAKSN
jgi:hypothetical protein